MKPEQKCPLCGGQLLAESWFGATRFDDKRFDYLECASCRSLVCSPMPDTETLVKMYGDAYLAVNKKASEADSPKKPEFVLALLKQAARPGVFLDYGCGEGELLTAAKQLGWEAIGFEYHPDVAGQVARLTGCLVTSDESQLFDGQGQPLADVLHLGDVVEHLTDLDHQFPRILEFLKPGGLLLAQGPLEAGPNLFTSVLRWSRLGRSRPEATMPPYHVILATVAGQRQFFRNHGLQEVEYRISEEDWPAPSRLSKRLVSRGNVLWGIRKLSQGLSLAGFGRLGNRYLYAGRK